MAFISIIRVIYLVHLHRNADPDFTWTGARFSFLSIIELNAAITVASTITLKPLAHRLMPNFLGANNLELPGDAPPTIGTRAGADGAHRDRANTKTQLEEWEVMRTDSENHTMASTSTSHR